MQQMNLQGQAESSSMHRSSSTCLAKFQQREDLFRRLHLSPVTMASCAAIARGLSTSFSAAAASNATSSACNAKAALPLGSFQGARNGRQGAAVQALVSSSLAACVTVKAFVNACFFRIDGREEIYIGTLQMKLWFLGAFANLYDG
jgi:hypothetical protein